MNQWLGATLLLFCMMPGYANYIPEGEIQDQQEDQTRCEQQRIQQCVNKCQSAGDSNCASRCEEEFKHACLQAGE